MAANFYQNPIADLGGDPGAPTPLPDARGIVAIDPNVQPLAGNLVTDNPAGQPLVPVTAPGNAAAAPDIAAQAPLQPALPFTQQQTQAMRNAAPASVMQEINGGKTPYQTAMEVAHTTADYLQNANLVANRANQFREVAVERLRRIYNRLQSIIPIVTNMQQGAAAAQNAQQIAQQAQQALVDLINAVNSQGYISQNQADAMADLASQLSQLNIPQMMAGLVQQINNLSYVLRNELGAQGAIVPPDQPGPMTGGRRKRKKAKKSRKRKKKHKGGFKYTRIANSRRSLRMTRRKSLRHKTHHKKHNKKHKRTKKHRRRKRR
jgi:hypothetical protein